MRYLGIDYGTKRVGIAISDIDGKMAFPHQVLSNSDQLIPDLLSLIKIKEIGEVVVGHSKHTDGSDNLLQSKINVFVKDLKKHTNSPIHLQSEEFSTQEAKRYQGKTDFTDASAAAIILNNCLLTVTPSSDSG